MIEDLIKIIDLATHYSVQKLDQESINGLMIPVWNVLQDFDNLANCNYVYLTTILPDKIKGPYCHTKRNSFLLAVTGETTLIIKENNMYTTYRLTPYVGAILPAQTELCIFGSGRTESVLLNLCDFPWTPNNTECKIPDFSGFDFSTIRNKK